MRPASDRAEAQKRALCFWVRPGSGISVRVCGFGESLHRCVQLDGDDTGVGGRGRRRQRQLQALGPDLTLDGKWQAYRTLRALYQGAEPSWLLPAYVLVAGTPAQPRSVNSEGLKRRGFSAESLATLKRAYKILYREGNTLAEAQKKLTAEAGEHVEILQLLAFLTRADRGIIR